MQIRFNAFDTNSVASAISQLQTLKSESDQKVQEACMDLAAVGAVQASLAYARTPYDGPRSTTVRVEPSEGGAKLIASGYEVLFLEYGAGAKYGYGHPDPNDYGPGTYNPLSDNWKNPNGWYYGHGQKTWGNPPAMGMYYAEQTIRERADEMMNGVFK